VRASPLNSVKTDNNLAVGNLTMFLCEGEGTFEKQWAE
jgi:hypothetical protein